MATETPTAPSKKSGKKLAKESAKAAKRAEKAAKKLKKGECCGEAGSTCCEGKQSECCGDSCGEKCGAMPKFKHVAKKKESSGKGASAAEIGQQLVALVNAGKSVEAEATLYHKNVETVECDGTRVESMKGVKEVGAWWHANMEVHSCTARGPFVSQTGFAVHMQISVTPKGGARMDMHEVCFYRVSKGKIVRAEFLSPAHGVAAF